MATSDGDLVRMYEALKRIGKGYMTPDQLRRKSEGKYGLPYEEALEYAYENIQQEAKAAIKGMRKPRIAATREAR